MVVSNNLLPNSFSFACIFQLQKVWAIFSHIVSSQPDRNECVAVLNIINETDPTCIRLFHLFFSDCCLCSRNTFDLLCVFGIRSFDDHGDQIDVQLDCHKEVGKKNSVFIENGHKFIHKRFLCLVTRQKSNSSVCCQIEKNFAGEEGCTLVRHQSSGGTNLFGKIICSFCFYIE